MKKLLIALIAGMLMIVPAMAMDTISDSDLDGISGQAGVTIGFGGAQTTEVTFDSISWGDPNGYTGATAAGYVVIDGTVGITVSIAAGQRLTLDVSGNSGGYTFSGTTITAGTPFIALGLPNQNITIDTPDMFVIGLGTAASTISGTIGTLTLENLDIDVTQATTMFIYAH